MLEKETKNVHKDSQKDSQCLMILIKQSIDKSNRSVLCEGILDSVFTEYYSVRLFRNIDKHTACPEALN